jgi:GT2 family glycosyltransferase
MTVQRLPSDTPYFSIVIPHWNGLRFLEVCFQALEAQNFHNFEVLLVDNGSIDESIAYTKKHFPWVTIIALPTNTGFANAVNVGIQAAKAPYIVPLNNDTEVANDWLSELHAATKKHPDVGFFACKMLDFKDRNIIDSCGDAISWTGRSWNVGQLQKDDGQFDQERLVFGACAGAAVYKRELFEKIGLLDTDFVTYLEDVDLDFRAQLAGFTCLYVPTARVYHIGSATAGKRSAFGFKMMSRNHLWIIYKNFPTAKLWANSGKLIYSEIRLLAAAFKYHFVREYYQGLWSACKGIPLMHKKRRQIQAGRAVSLTYLDSVITANFPYKSLSEALRR